MKWLKLPLVVVKEIDAEKEEDLGIPAEMRDGLVLVCEDDISYVIGDRDSSDVSIYLKSGDVLTVELTISDMETLLR